jgi:hypothetical protein
MRLSQSSKKAVGILAALTFVAFLIGRWLALLSYPPGLGTTKNVLAWSAGPVDDTLAKLRPHPRGLPSSSAQWCLPDLIATNPHDLPPRLALLIVRFAPETWFLIRRSYSSPFGRAPPR